jgi:hypothetical protein
MTSSMERAWSPDALGAPGVAPPARGASTPAPGALPHPPSSPAAAPAAAAAAAASSGGACPLRRWLGPYAGLIFNKHDKLVCPEPILRARAALAATPPVRGLRPQALPVKLLAVGAMALAVNLPAGALREHFDKFSLGWILAVHVTVPFVAMLRKAVVLPKLALLVTLTSAVLGQVLGSRLERARMAAAAAPPPVAQQVVIQRGAGAGAAPRAAAAAAPDALPAAALHPALAMVSAGGRGMAGKAPFASLSLGGAGAWGGQRGWGGSCGLVDLSEPGEWLMSRSALAVKTR